jgi:hypothetical protein
LFVTTTEFLAEYESDDGRDYLLLFSKLLAQLRRANFLSKCVALIFNQLFLLQITSDSLDSSMKN